MPKSSLQRIRETVEEKVNERLIDIVYLKALSYHCKQGLNKDCDCSFCTEKRRASISVSLRRKATRHIFAKSASQRLKELRYAPFIGE